MGLIVPLYLWAKTVKELDNHKCAFCGSTEKLEAHHIRKKSLFPELKNDIDNGITLCHKCHVIAHAANYSNSGLSVSTKITKKQYELVSSFIEDYEISHFAVAFPKGQKDIIKAHAEANGESVNGFINRAIDETMSRDNAIKEAVSEWLILTPWKR